MTDARANGRPQPALVAGGPGHGADSTGTDVVSDVRLWTPPGTDVLPAAGNGTPHNRRRWLTRERFRGLLSIVVILVIGAGVLYWRANSGFVKTDNAQTHGDLAPSAPA